MEPTNQFQKAYPRLWEFFGAYMADWDYEYPDRQTAIVAALGELHKDEKAAIAQDLEDLLKNVDSFWMEACEQMYVVCNSADDLKQLLEAGLNSLHPDKT